MREANYDAGGGAKIGAITGAQSRSGASVIL